MVELSKQITICSLSCGEETLNDSLASMSHFIHSFEFLPIRDITPQVKALNEMFEKTQTEYLIPVDADMILYPDAYLRILQAIEKHRNDKTWHSILFPLWDTFTQRKILALKVMRTNLMKRFLFENSPTPDVEHYERLKNAGYCSINDYLEEAPIGDHVLKGSKFCYLKYKDVYLTLRYHQKEWDSGVFLGGKTIKEKSKKHFDFFLYSRIIKDCEDYLWAIAGMADGLTRPVSAKSKDMKDAILIDKDQAIDAYLDWCLSKDLLNWEF